MKTSLINSILTLPFRSDQAKGVLGVEILLELRSK